MFDEPRPQCPENNWQFHHSMRYIVPSCLIVKSFGPQRLSESNVLNDLKQR